MVSIRIFNLQKVDQGHELQRRYLRQQIFYDLEQEKKWWDYLKPFCVFHQRDEAYTHKFKIIMLKY